MTSDNGVLPNIDEHYCQRYWGYTIKKKATFSPGEPGVESGPDTRAW